MPIIKLKRKGKTCYKWGKSGKVYCGAGAREKALKQARAIKASQKK